MNKLSQRQVERWVVEHTRQEEDLDTSTKKVRFHETNEEIAAVEKEVQRKRKRKKPRKKNLFYTG